MNMNAGTAFMIGEEYVVDGFIGIFGIHGCEGVRGRLGIGVHHVVGNYLTCETSAPNANG